MNVIAVSAPESKENRCNSKSLTSETPFSLQNALVECALRAKMPGSMWYTSNWRGGSPEVLGNYVKMYHSMEDDKVELEALLSTNPDLLLIGAMSISYRGAIEIATLAKKIKEDLIVVLGGYHVNETIFHEDQSDVVRHHAGSPLLHMAKRKIDHVFDFVISGEGEYIVAELGEMLGGLLNTVQESYRSRLMNIASLIEAKKDLIPGEWILGYVDENRHIHTISERGRSIDRSVFPATAAIFGTQGSFEIFKQTDTETIRTAHVMDGVAKACVNGCMFCSENKYKLSPPKGTKQNNEQTILSRSHATSLYSRFRQITEQILADGDNRQASAFVEDSVLLNASASQMKSLYDLLLAGPLPLRWGGQLTIPDCLRLTEEIYNLSKVGLEYLFIGVETQNPIEIGGMAKDRDSSVSWMERTEQVMKNISEYGIKVGISLVFGMGESQQSRVELLDKIHDWQKKYGEPRIISANWGVVHPMKGRGMGGDTQYEYLHWPVNHVYHEMFKHYGEASTEYIFPHTSLPTDFELIELEKYLNVIRNFNNLE